MPLPIPPLPRRPLPLFIIVIMIIGAVAGLFGISGITVFQSLPPRFVAASTTAMVAGDTVRLTCPSSLSGAFDRGAVDLTCAAATVPATAVPAPTAAPTLVPTIVPTVSPTAAPAAAATCRGMVVPSYYDTPTQADWTTLINAGSATVPYALFAPHSGPGTVSEAAWVTLRGRLRTAGIKAIGYSDTRNATRPIAEVKTEIDRYEAWYQLDGIFIDNADQKPSSVPYLVSIRDYMQSKMPRNTTYILNVGIYPDSSYASIGAIMNMEATYTDWSSRGPVPAWASALPIDRFSAIVISATQAQMQIVYSTAQARHMGYLYVEDSPGGSTFQHVPSYWSAEVTTERTTCS